jgi:hypothetical protein
MGCVPRTRTLAWRTSPTSSWSERFSSSCGQPVLVGELRGARAVKVQGAELESVQNGSA